jgi:hypothetical protein
LNEFLQAFRQIKLVVRHVSVTQCFIWRKPCADIQCIGGADPVFEADQAAGLTPHLSIATIGPAVR